jgi:SAM-dependent methyltransferase
MTTVKEWFGEWFDSPYYHILYKHRDHEDARAFIDNLVTFFNLKPSDRVLDLACGKGRHSIYLNSLGFDVTGLDLSGKNIEFAQKFGNERLRFFQQDMREEYSHEEFDYILNLFTSFGYFETKAENQNAISTAAKALKKNGFFLLDFLNAYRVIHNLVPSEEKSIDGIDFRITRRFCHDDFIIKDISFEHKGVYYNYHEKVKAIRRVEFLEYFKSAGLEVLHVFGDYKLSPYDKENSERMIFVAKKY